MLSGNPPVLLLPCDDPTSEIFSTINIPMGIIPFQTQFALLLRPVGKAGRGREQMLSVLILQKISPPPPPNAHCKCYMWCRGNGARNKWRSLEITTDGISLFLCFDLCFCFKYE